MTKTARKSRHITAVDTAIKKLTARMVALREFGALDSEPLGVMVFHLRRAARGDESASLPDTDVAWQLYKMPGSCLAALSLAKLLRLAVEAIRAVPVRDLESLNELIDQHT